MVLLAPPGRCRGPLLVSDITKSTCRLRWRPPEDDGGSRVTHYVVEKQEIGKPYWTTVASFCKVSLLSNHINYWNLTPDFHVTLPQDGEFINSLVQKLGSSITLDFYRLKKLYTPLFVKIIFHWKEAKC